MKHSFSPEDVPGFMRKLNALKAESGLTDPEIGIVCAVERKAVSRWRRGETFPDLVSFRQMCLLFNVSADWLLGLEGTSDKDIWNLNVFEHGATK